MNLSWAYGDPPPHAEKVRLLERALELGYDHFDTSNIYGLGRNETLLGEAIMHARGDFLLASKTGIVVQGAGRGIDCRPEAMLASLDESLARLKTDHIDLFYMHRLDRKVPVADMVGALHLDICVPHHAGCSTGKRAGRLLRGPRTDLSSSTAPCAATHPVDGSRRAFQREHRRAN